VGRPRLFFPATAGAAVQRDHTREKIHAGSRTNKSKRDHHVQRCRNLFSAFRKPLSRKSRSQNVGVLLHARGTGRDPYGRMPPTRDRFAKAGPLPPCTQPCRSCGTHVRGTCVQRHRFLLLGILLLCTLVSCRTPTILRNTPQEKAFRER
jgi:hypothetical protein